MTASSSWHTEWKAFKKTIQQHLRKTTFLNVCMSLRSKCWSGRELGSHEKDGGTDLLGTEIGECQFVKFGHELREKTLGPFFKLQLKEFVKGEEIHLNEILHRRNSLELNSSVKNFSEGFLHTPYITKVVRIKICTITKYARLKRFKPCASHPNTKK